MSKRVSARRLLVAIACVAIQCARAPEAPEEQIRGVVAEAERAARDKDVQTLKDLVSERYADAEERDKNALKAMLMHYFFQHRTIHLLTRIEVVRFPVASRAEVTLLAALAGTQIPDASILPTIHADLYRFELVLDNEEDGRWRVTRAAWRPAALEDFAE